MVAWLLAGAIVCTDAGDLTQLDHQFSEATLHLPCQCSESIAGLGTRLGTRPFVGLGNLDRRTVIRRETSICARSSAGYSTGFLNKRSRETQKLI